MAHSESAPTARIAKFLGYGGLIPFLSFAALIRVDREHMPLWHGYLLAYGGLILSFVGAIHWGIAMNDNGLPVRERRAVYAWSVVPSLLAFVAIALDSVVSNWILVGGFLIHYVMDLRIAKQTALPAWYLALRLRLSLIAAICLAASAWGTAL